MSDRAQLDTLPLRWRLAPTALLLLVVVLNRLFDAEELTIKPTPEAAGEMSVFAVPWGEVLPVAGVVCALALVIGVVTRSGVAPSVFRGGGDE